MDDYVSLPAQRLAHLVKKYVHHSRMKEIEGVYWAGLLGGSGGAVNSLDFFYFLCVLSSQWKAVTVNL